MDKMIREVIEKAENLLEKVKSYEIRILAFKAENKLLEAIKAGLELLEQLGEKFPKKPNMAHVMTSLLASKIRLRGKDNDTLANLPPMADENKIAAMRIMAGIASSSYWATPTLFPLIIFRMVQLSLKYGNTQVSSFAFATYGVIMCGVLGDMKNGYQFGKLGLILLEKYKAKEWKTQVYTPIYCLIVNWNEHIDQTLKPLQESYHIGMETGAIEFACINTNIYCIHSYLSGKPLERLEVETKAYSQSFHLFGQETNFNYNEVYRQAMLNLMGVSADPIRLQGDAYDEEKMIVQNEERNDKTGLFFLHFNKLILSYIFGEYEKGLKHAEESRKLLEAVLAKFEIPNHHYYEALTMLALFEDANSGTKRKLLKRIKSNAKKLKTWAKDAPENFQHKYEILLAELYRIKGDNKNASLLYDKAIQGASKQNFIHEEGIARELIGQFYASFYLLFRN
jgi:predicted ATPase